MKKFLIYFISIAFLIIAVSSCSEVNEDISEPTEVLSVHKEGIANPESENFHAKILVESNWDLEQCQNCHASDYSGGPTEASCLKCHTDDAGPESCNTCHSDYSEPEPDSFHSAHLFAEHSSDVACATCHNVPAEVNSEGHLDGEEGAEIIFAGLAGLSTNAIGTEYRNDAIGTIEPNPEYDPSDQSCSNTYCHGNFKNGNTENIAYLNEDIKCGSCHGDAETGNPLPGGTHPSLTTNCSLCHSQANSSNHINGKLNVYGKEIEF